MLLRCLLMESVVNRQRRKMLSAAIRELSLIKDQVSSWRFGIGGTPKDDVGRVVESIRKLKEVVEEAYADEDEAFENLPEGLRDSERGYLMESATQAIGQAVDGLDSVIDHLIEAIEA